MAYVNGIQCFEPRSDDATLLLTKEDSRIGGKQFIFPFGEAFTAKKHDDVLAQFQYNYLDEQFDVVLPTLAGTAERGVTDSVAYVKGLTTDDEAIIRSKDAIRYRPGHSGYIDFTLGAITDGGGKVYCGGFDEAKDHGFAIKVDNEVMYFGFFKDGNEKGSDFSNSFDQVSTSGIDLTKLNIYRIVFGYLGIANPTLFIRIGGEWKKLHEIQTEGKALDTHTSTPVFPICIIAEDDAEGYTASWSGGVVGNGTRVGDRGFAFPNSLIVDGASAEQGEMQLSGTDVSTVIIFHAKTTFKGKPNNAKARLLSFSFDVETTGTGNGVVIFQLIGVQTLSGTPSYSDINANSSIIEYDHTNGTGASVDATAGVPIITRQVPYSSSFLGGANPGEESIDAEAIGAFAYADDTFAIIAKDTGSNNPIVRININWEELF